MKSERSWNLVVALWNSTSSSGHLDFGGAAVEILPRLGFLAWPVLSFFMSVVTALEFLASCSGRGRGSMDFVRGRGSRDSGLVLYGFGPWLRGFSRGSVDLAMTFALVIPAAVLWIWPWLWLYGFLPLLYGFWLWPLLHCFWLWLWFSRFVSCTLDFDRGRGPTDLGSGFIDFRRVRQVYILCQPQSVQTIDVACIFRKKTFSYKSVAVPPWILVWRSRHFSRGILDSGHGCGSVEIHQGSGLWTWL